MTTFADDIISTPKKGVETMEAKELWTNVRR